MKFKRHHIKYSAKDFYTNYEAKIDLFLKVKDDISACNTSEFLESDESEDEFDVDC